MANELITREDIERGKQNFDAFNKYLDGGAHEKVRLPGGKLIKTRAGIEKEISDKFPDTKAGLYEVGVMVGQVPLMTDKGVATTGFGYSSTQHISSSSFSELTRLPNSGLYYLGRSEGSDINDLPSSGFSGAILDVSPSPSIVTQVAIGSPSYSNELYFRSGFLDNEGLEEWTSIYHSRNKKPYQTTTADPANLVVTDTGELRRTTSSRVFKDRIKNLDVEDYRTLLKSVQPVSYHSKNTSDDPDRIWYSFIAEDLVKVDSRLVQLSPVEFYEDTDEEGNTFVNSRDLPEGEFAPSGLNLNGIITMLTRINQYMLDDIEALEAEKTQLKSRMTKLEKRLESLEKQFVSE